MSRRLKVQIVEPSAIVVEGLTLILHQADKFELLPPLHEPDDFSAQTEQPDLLIVNPTLLSYGKQSKWYEIGSDCSVVALVYQYVEPAILRAYNAVLDIRENRERIPEILYEAHQNSQKPLLKVENYELTDRETEVLVLVAQGLMSKEIADKLNISVYTVVSHRKNITRKTGIKSVAGLAVYAMLHNLMEAPSMA